MKKVPIVAAACALSLCAAGALAQPRTQDMKGMDVGAKAAAAAPARTHHAVGVVKSVDAKSGTVMLSHEAIASLNWPAMTMGFDVQDRTLLDKLAVNRKVEVDFRQDGSRYVITAVR